MEDLALFADRADAGRRLAQRLARYRGQDVLVLGIPRGGVPVAAEVARILEAELDVVVTRKVGAPDQPELALGAVTANGRRFFNDAIVRELEVSADYLERTVAQQMTEAHRREERFRGGRPKGRIEGRIVLLVDDGLATGATMRAAVRSVRAQHPLKLVVAVPVGSAEACDALRAEVDELVCLDQPEPFFAVGLHYAEFNPVEDVEVERILRETRSPLAAATGGRPTPTAKTTR
jgi:predicted phosphoribosyltransferase